MRTALGLLTGALTLALAVPLGPPALAVVERSAGPTCDGRRATIVGTSGEDRLVGTPGDDVIVARGGRDYVAGRGGADIICGGPEIDRLHGGLGDDQVLGQRDGFLYVGGDRLFGGPGDDLLVGGDTRWEDTIYFRGAPRGVVLDLAEGTSSGQGNDVLRGITTAVLTKHNDEVRGLKEDSNVYTLGGDDRMTEAATAGWDGSLATGRGRDVVDSAGRGSIALGPGADTVDARGPQDVYGEEGNDTIRLHRLRGGSTVLPGDGDDVITGSPGPDTIYASSGDDTAMAGDGDDEVWDGGGADDIDGGPGDDVIKAGFGPDRYDGGEGRDQINYEEVYGAAGIRLDLAAGTVTGAVSGSDTILGFEAVAGSPNDDHISGTSLANRLEGASGDDVLLGRGGDDRLIGDPGVDRANGGPGTDTCSTERRVRCED